ncbi:hypothetical protein GCM10010987_06470 [Bradyrhizobium guangdongense]|uniref:Uncharacterized protein n=1 Tax=Bradyrhizobium guangdongense TaxID=1325090 RepID=A0AA88B6C2_9BRAD|nr:hypothetical protein GCM10010987_06470 [Bradyrhizobium guangdongense]
MISDEIEASPEIGLAPLPLAGEVDALARAWRVRAFSARDISRVERAPSPTLPRKRERGCTFSVAAVGLNLIALAAHGFRQRARCPG